MAPIPEPVLDVLLRNQGEFLTGLGERQRARIRGFAFNDANGAAIQRETVLAYCDLKGGWPSNMVGRFVVATGEPKYMPDVVYVPPYDPIPTAGVVVLGDCAFKPGAELSDVPPDAWAALARPAATSSGAPPALGETVSVPGRLVQYKDGPSVDVGGEIDVSLDCAVGDAPLGASIVATGVLDYIPPVFIADAEPAMHNIQDSLPHFVIRECTIVASRPP